MLLHNPRVSIVIPSYNRGARLADTIRMAAAQNYSLYEVIVVDQDPDIPEVVLQAISLAQERVKLIRLNYANLPAARNAGVRSATGEIVIFIDDDVIIEPDFVQNHVRAYTNAAVGGVTGLTLLPHETDLIAVEKRLKSTFRVLGNSSDGTARIEWIVGCNCSFRKSAIIRAGMSDPRFTGWGEDADLCVRIRALGYGLIFDPKIRLVHLALPTGGCELRHSSERKAEEICRMHLFLYLKNRNEIGRGRAILQVWWAYRQYVLNRKILRSVRRFIWRHGLFFRSLVGAVHLCMTPVGDQTD